MAGPNAFRKNLRRIEFSYNWWGGPINAAITFITMPTDVARAHQAGAPDANGQKPERHISMAPACRAAIANGMWQLTSPI